MSDTPLGTSSGNSSGIELQVCKINFNYKFMKFKLIVELP